MSDDEPDLELLSLLRKSLGLGPPDPSAPPETKVLQDAEFIYNNSIDVALDMRGTKNAAIAIWDQMQQREYSAKTWSDHELHPKSKDESAVNFIFTMDLLNFCFWSEKGREESFAIEWKGKRWTGYWSLVAALQRALDENIPITTPTFWSNEEECTEDLLRTVFRSATSEEIPLFSDRLACLREAGQILDEEFDGSVVALIEDAEHSAAGLVNLLAEHFPCFRDEHMFEGRKVRILKRAQIFVADLWAALEGEGWGEFGDIEKITMFADYRIPQILYSLGCLTYSPPLESRIRHLIPLESGHSWEVQLRGCSIWTIELIRREIIRLHPTATVNAILIDFFLYDFMKEVERDGEESIPHHRVRSVWY